MAKRLKIKSRQNGDEEEKKMTQNAFRKTLKKTIKMPQKITTKNYREKSKKGRKNDKNNR